MRADERRRDRDAAQPGANVDCTFTDTKLASISIEKDTIGGDGSFDIVEPTLGTKTVTTSGGVGTVDYLGVLPGTYHLSESPKAGWAPFDFTGDCASDGTVVVPAGDAIQCSITNVKLGRVTLAEVTEPAGSPNLLDFTAPSGVTPTSFQLGDGVTQSFDDLNPGQDYTFTQTVPAGWSLARLRRGLHVRPRRAQRHGHAQPRRRPDLHLHRHEARVDHHPEDDARR